MTSHAIKSSMRIVLTLLIVLPCLWEPAHASTTASRHYSPMAVLGNMLFAQRNLNRFEEPAVANIFISGARVFSAKLTVIAERPNYVAVRWMGITIRPRRGLIFIDPNMLVGSAYTLCEAGNVSYSDDGFAMVRATTAPGAQPRLDWTFWIDTSTWLIRRASVTADDGPPCRVAVSYRPDGPGKWIPVTISAEGRMVLEEFLPDFLITLLLARADSSAPARVDLVFTSGGKEKA